MDATPRTAGSPVLSCETCGAEIVGKPYEFWFPLARVCQQCHRSGMSVSAQCRAMLALGHKPNDARRWPSNLIPMQEARVPNGEALPDAPQDEDGPPPG